jgi:DNA repair exonuclease SbcCD ATPase subunit
MSTIGMELLKLDDDYNVIEDLTQSSVIKTKQYIQEHILGCNFDVFKSSIVVSYVDFMNFYEGMNKDQKRKYIETLFNLNCFGEMFSMIKTDINEIKRESTNTKNEILKLASFIDELNNKFNNYNNSLEEKRNSIKSKIIERANEVKNLKEKNNLIICEDSNNLLKSKNEIKSNINNINSSITKYEKCKLKNEIKIENLEKSIVEIQEISQGLCKDCIQVINEKYNYNVKKQEIENLTFKIDEIVKLIDDLNNKLEIENHKLDEINSQIEINNINKTKKYKIETNINVLLNEINNLKSSFDEINNNSENPFASLLQNNKQALISLKERLIIYNKNLKHLEVLKDVCSETGVKKFIIKDIVKLLNSLIQKYLNEIGGEFIVYFDETFDFKFLTSTGECEFSNFSAGERQRIQIATILAFRDIILSSKISANIFVIDELLDANVDTICIENVMTILKRKSIELNQNVFIISHRSELADNESIWDNIIKVTKDQGQSTYQIK